MTVKNRRRSGVLLPAASLPSRFGAGDFGSAARAFAVQLGEAGQRIWQVLPLTVPDFVHSPYASPSAFAGNPLLIDPMQLAADGLLRVQDAQAWERQPAGRADYAYAARAREALLRQAYRSFAGSGRCASYDAFLARERYWLEDYVLFDALKARFGGKPFWEWQHEGARLHRPAALRPLAQEMAEELDFRRFVQYVFDTQLSGLRAFLSERGIALLGDIPFYVARDSADVWAHPELFLLREDRTPRLVAGVPPDYFSQDGQLWGNPVYDWERAAEDGYAWWLRRLARCARMYDATRLDHFRAFDSYYTVRAAAKTARTGRWRRGPGKAFFDAVKMKLPALSLIAEDLGDLSPSVEALRRYTGMPGMRVMQFAFGGGADNAFLPHNYERNTVVYPGTHDNDTTAGWWASLGERERSHAASYLGISPAAAPAEAARRLTAAASASVADTAIFTVQDLTGAGSEARINTPSQAGGCWEYAAREPVMPDGALAYLKSITRLYGRWEEET